MFGSAENRTIGAVIMIGAAGAGKYSVSEIEVRYDQKVLLSNSAAHTFLDTAKKMAKPYHPKETVAALQQVQEQCDMHGVKDKVIDALTENAFDLNPILWAWPTNQALTPVIREDLYTLVRQEQSCRYELDKMKDAETMTAVGLLAVITGYGLYKMITGR